MHGFYCAKQASSVSLKCLNERAAAVYLYSFAVLRPRAVRIVCACADVYIRIAAPLAAAAAASMEARVALAFLAQLILTMHFN